MYLMAWMVIGAYNPGFLSMGLPETVHILESPTQIRELTCAVQDEMATLNQELLW